MIPIHEALDLVEQQVAALAPRRVDLADAAGLVLAKDIASDTNSPPHDKAMMDGYAITGRDPSPERRVIGVVAAGEVPHHAVTPGTTVKIMTGAPLPEGADAVVPWEQVETVGDDIIRLPIVAVESGTNVMRLGASMRSGQTVVPSGTLLRPIEIAIIAEAGHNRITAIPRPTVAVLPTGNELVSVGQATQPGHIRNSNGPLLCAATTAAGGVPRDLGIGPDNVDQLKRLVTDGLREDVRVVSGGVSAGDFDLVPRVLAESGVRNIFHKVALKPGKPLWFGVAEIGDHRTLVFGLPGNPVSSFVCFLLFVRPALAALAGRGFAMASTTARLSAAQPPSGVRAGYLPARLSTGPEAMVDLVSWQGSADLAALTQANCLAVFPAGTEPFEAGTPVEVVPF
jgi:molybdopterin molybdotransferase